MKLLLQKTKIGKPAPAMVATASIACLGLALVPKADAGVTWLVSESGADLVLITDGGSLSVTQADLGTHGALNSYGQIGADSNYVMANVSNRWYQDLNSGAVSGNDPWILGKTTTTVFTGHTFMFFNTDLYWDSTLGATPGTITPVSSLTFEGLDIATAFGGNLDAGPVVLWTHGQTQDTISINLASNVPEPSSTALLGLGGLSLLLRRRR